jgi:hypothetical protein
LSSNPDADLPDLYEVRITGTPDAVRHVLAKFELDIGCRRPHVDVHDDRTVTLHAFASEAKVAEIASANVAVERGANITALGRERQAEVGTGDRFEGGRVAPQGLGTLVRDGKDGREQS